MGQSLVSQGAEVRDGHSMRGAWRFRMGTSRLVVWARASGSLPQALRSLWLLGCPVAGAGSERVAFNYCQEVVDRDGPWCLVRMCVCVFVCVCVCVC